jgi:AcrR family transcriptional regulator
VTDESTWLRQAPRQQRAIRRIEALLDTAEVVFEEVGYDGATTNLIAERAEIPVGTLYRWFPDKAALAEGLATRYLGRMSKAYEHLVAVETPPTEIIRDVTHQLAAVVIDSPAMPALVSAATLPANESSAGAQLKEAAQTSVKVMLRLRAPSVSVDDLERVSDVVTTVAFSVLARACRLPEPARIAMVDELADLLISWLAARFPGADDPVWQAPNPLVAPIAATLAFPATPGAKHGMGGRDA